MKEDKFRKIKKRSVRGLVVLTFRTILLQLVNFAGYFFITIFLDKKEFGFFILISALVDIMAYFSDIGLAAALIQKKKKPSLKEIRSTFTIQEAIVLILILLMIILSPMIKKAYHLDKEGMILLYSLSLAFFLSSLKTIPSVLLERKLQFNKIVIPQYLETICFNFLVVFLAWKGWGLKSYTAAVLCRAIIGTLAIYWLAPWSIGFNFSFRVLRKLLKFGVPYQLNTLLATLKDKFTILILARIIGSEGLALVGWAEKWATMPLRYFLDNTVKIAFPAFSRLQKDKTKLKIAIEKALYFLSLLILPSLTGLAVLAPILIKIIPRYLKWEPALTPLLWYCLASAGGALAVFITTVFNSIGKIKTTFKFMILWTVLTWLITPLMAIKIGFLGVALATFLVNATVILAALVLKKIMPVNFSAQILGPLLASIIMFLIIILIREKFSYNFTGILGIIITAVLIYGTAIFLLEGEKLSKEINFFIKEIKNKT